MVDRGITPGPWRWELNKNSGDIELSGGVPEYDLTVMDFCRCGMDGAAPRFNCTREAGYNAMVRADKLGVVVPGREHHADWFQCIDHPDARLIAAAPDLLAACEAAMPILYEMMTDYCADLQEGGSATESGDAIIRATGALAAAIQNAGIDLPDSCKPPTD